MIEITAEFVQGGIFSALAQDNELAVVALVERDSFPGINNVKEKATLAR